MDLDTLIIEADPARRITDAGHDSGPDSAAALRIYRDITRHRPGLRSRRSRFWQVPRRASRPAAVFVGVAVVLVATIVAVRADGPASGPGPALRGGAAASADLGMPPYFVTVGERAGVTIRDSDTGKSLVTLSLPGEVDPKLVQVAPAGSDRRFVVETGVGETTRFYLLRVASGGRSARLSRLPIPLLAAGEVTDDIAVSPDGRRLAVAEQREGRISRGTIEVASLSGGAVRHWTASSAGLPVNLSWRQGGQEVAFYWDDESASAGSTTKTKTGLWLLNTTPAGSNLMSARRIGLDMPRSEDVQSAMLSPGGRTVIAAFSTHRGVLHQGAVTGGIAALSARTGRAERTLLVQHAVLKSQGHYFAAPCTMYGLDATGRHLLVDCNGFGRLDNGHFTAMPAVPPLTSAGW
jgi:hypothetical protein